MMVCVMMIDNYELQYLHIMRDVSMKGGKFIPTVVRANFPAEGFTGALLGRGKEGWTLG